MGGRESARAPMLAIIKQREMGMKKGEEECHGGATIPGGKDRPRGLGYLLLF